MRNCSSSYLWPSSLLTTVSKIYSVLCTFFDFVSSRFFDGTELFSTLTLDATGVQVRNGKTMLEDYEIYNSTSSILFVKFYDTISQPDPATDTPTFRIMIPALSGANIPLLKRQFSTGLWVRATTGVADTDNVSPAANALLINLGYRSL